MVRRKDSAIIMLYSYVWIWVIWKAGRYFRKAMEIELMNADPYYRYAWMLRDYMKDNQESEKYLLKALGINDTYCGVNGECGYLLYLMGEYERAIEYMVRELKVSDDNGTTHFVNSLLNKALGE